MKKKGTALILSMLMLAFFLVLTLTMYSIARNRNLRSVFKIKGMKLDSALNSGLALAHYELYLADEYVSKGRLYSTTVNRGDSYPNTTPTQTTRYYDSTIDPIVPIVGQHYTGIVLGNYNEYFSTYWNPNIGSEINVDSGSTVTDDVKRQPWVMEEKVGVNGKVLSRAWGNDGGEKRVRLWGESLGTTKRSIGGYRLTEITGVDKNGIDLTLPLDINKIEEEELSATEIIFTYEKIISMESDELTTKDKNNIEINIVENYKVIYKELVKVIKNGSNIQIISDDLEGMTVEKLK
ncbi:MAG: hypothetical protein KAH04_02005 [Psychrilyobacter sp.]|nr:hypothetical protein [Psychrilyobacter sp.]